MGEYQKPNHTISKNIKTLIISRAEKNIFFSSSKHAALQAKTQTRGWNIRNKNCLIRTLQMFSTGANTLHERSCRLHNPGYCATEELASSFIWGLDDDSFSGKMHARLNLLLWCKIFHLNFQKRCKNLCQSTLSVLLLPPFTHYFKTLDVLFLSKWMSALARSLLRYLPNVFSSTETTVCPSTEDIVVALYCKYIPRGVTSLKCLWRV